MWAFNLYECANFFKRCSDGNFEQFLSYYYCKTELERLPEKSKFEKLLNDLHNVI